VAGGVSANSYLRQKMNDQAKSFGVPFYAPALQYCTDNAGMIAIAGYYKYLASEFTTLTAPTLARMPFAKAQK
jgi:N6-L-threonylcarbamoyladenine synthase